MKQRYLYTLTVFFILSLFSSCIKKEGPNMEADILTAAITDSSLLSDAPTITNNTVVFRLNESPQNYNFAPTFGISAGATISPASGTTLDFTHPQAYTVTSQDGKWSKTYTVSFISEDTTNTLFPFENVDVDSSGQYDIFFDYNINQQKVYDWASGNEGYKLILLIQNTPMTPDKYPTFQVNDGYLGKAVEMTTLATDSLGQQLGSPLAAGNLYIGTFNLTFPAINSTRFGLPYLHKRPPLALKGYFKYKRGTNFIVNNPPSAITQDRWNAYAILFEKTPTNNYLPGDHNFQDPRIVSIAKLDPANAVEANQWTEFNIPFQFVNGKTFDPTKEYMYTIVFTSSEEGADYNGAVGSTLWIDQVSLVLQ